MTVPHRRVVKAADGVRMRRRDLPPEDVTSVRGLCVTGLPLSVLEAAVELENGSVFLDRALQRHTIEVDGWAWHRDPARHRHDLERQNVLVNAGRHVLRFTWHALANDPEGVVRQIRQIRQALA